MALERLEKIGEPILVKAYGIGDATNRSDGPSVGHNEMENLDRIIEAVERNAPDKATHYEMIKEVNAAKNLDYNIAEFLVQYYH